MGQLLEIQSSYYRSASQKQLGSDVVESNIATKTGKQISAYPKMSAHEVSHDKRRKAACLTKIVQTNRERNGL